MTEALAVLGLRWALLCGIFALTDWIMDDRFDVNGGVGGFLLATLMYALVNAGIGPVLRALTLPINVVTLGLFGLVVNGVLLLIAAWLTDALSVDGLVSAMLAGLVLSVLSMVVNVIGSSID